MYSYELEKLIKNGQIKRDDYIKNFNPISSPQIMYEKYNPEYCDFYVKTNDGYEFFFKVID